MRAVLNVDRGIRICLAHRSAQGLGVLNYPLQVFGDASQISSRDPSSIRATCWDWRSQVVRDLSAQYLQNRDFLEKQTSQRRAGEEQRTDAYQVLAPCL